MNKITLFIGGGSMILLGMVFIFSGIDKSESFISWVAGGLVLMWIGLSLP